MASIFDSLKGLITPELISQASTSLGEEKSGVTKAVLSAVPSILGSVLAKGNDSGLESILKQAGSSNILSNLSGIFSGKSDEQTSGIGSTFLNSLLGDKLGGVTSLISSLSGISGESSNKLFSMLGPLVGGFLGKKMSTDGLNLSGLLSTLGSEKSSFMNLIPKGLSSFVDLSSITGLASSALHSAGSAVDSVVDTAKSAANVGFQETKSSFGWLKWLIPLLIFLGAIIFAWKSCSTKAAEDVVSTAQTTVAATIEDAKETVRSLSDFSLPDGTLLKAYQGGIESQLITFLQSDEYKKASTNDLKDKWFNFDNINFKFGSATELTDESYKQVDNVVSILKYFKGSKVKIGAYTDKKGDSAANLKLSQERAATLQKLLGEKGIASQIVGAEGYGDKFATIDATATDAERAVDRKMALRFEK